MEVGAGSSLLYSPQISSTAGWGRTARRDYRESSAERDGHIANRSFALVGTMVVIPVNLPYARRATDCRAGRARLGAGPQRLQPPPPHTPVAPRRALQTDESTREPRPTLTSSLPRPLQREDLGLPCSSSDRGLHSRLYWEEVRCRASRVAAADTRRCVGMDMSSGGQLRAPQVGAQVHREHGAAPWLSGLHVPLVTSPHSRTSTANNDQRPKTERYH